ncbi:MAG: hypothetical protein AB3N20_03435 [Rhizobiaceae bacterium]
MDDWKIAINRNRRLLGDVIAELLALAQRQDTLRRSVLRILRPAESALRRLIVVVAAMLQQKLREKQSGEAAEVPLPDFSSFATHDTLPAFQLIDPQISLGAPMRPIASGIPRICVPGVFDPAPLPKPDDALDAVKLLRRIRRLKIALATLPRQARRLNRLMAKRAKAEPGPGRVGPIRPGHPPGHRQRPREPVDDLLRECHWLAMECERAPP